MSAGHADLVLRCQSYWSNRDLENLLEVVADDAVLDLSRNILNPDVYHGHDGLRRWFASMVEIWSQFEIVGTEVIGESGDKVVTAALVKGIGRSSGATAEMEISQVWTIRDGKVSQLTGGYRSRDEALEGAGMA